MQTIVFSSDGALIASVADNGTVRLWNVSDGKEALYVPEADRWIEDVSFSRDGTAILTVRSDGVLERWDVATGKVIGATKVASSFHCPVAVSPDWKWIAAVEAWDETRTVARVTIREVATGVVPWSSRLDVGDVAFSPDSKAVAVAERSAIRVLSLPHGEEILSLRTKAENIREITYSSDGRRIAFGDAAGTGHVWDLERKTEFCTFRAGEELEVHVAFPECGRVLAIGGMDSIGLLDGTSGAIVRVIDRKDLQSHMCGLALTSTTIAAGGNTGIIDTWDVATGEMRLADLNAVAHLNWVWKVAFLGNRRLLTESADGTVRAWDARTGDHILRYGLQPSVGRPCCAVGGGLVACNEHPHIRLVRADTGESLAAIKADFDPTGRLALSHNGKLLAVSKSGAGVALWDVPRRHERLILTGTPLWGSQGGAVSFSLDDRFIAVAGYDGVAVFEAETGTRVRIWKAGTAFNGVEAVSISPDNSVVAAGWGGREGATICLWSVSSGRNLLRFQVSGREIAAVVFSPCGKYLLSGGGGRGPEGRTMRVWDAKTGVELMRLGGHRGRIDSIAFSPDGKLLASGSKDTSALVWDWPKIEKMITP